MARNARTVAAFVIVAGVVGLVVLSATTPDESERTYPKRVPKRAPVDVPEPDFGPAPQPASLGTGVETRAKQLKRQEPPAAPQDPLETRVSLDFADADVAEVIGYVAIVSRLKVSMDAQKRTALEQIPVTLKLTDVTVREFLSTLRRIGGNTFSFTVEGDVLHVR